MFTHRINGFGTHGLRNRPSAIAIQWLDDDVHALSLERAPPALEHGMNDNLDRGAKDRATLDRRQPVPDFVRSRRLEEVARNVRKSGPARVSLTVSDLRAFESLNPRK